MIRRRKQGTTAAPMAIRVTLDRVLLDRRMSLTELGDRQGKGDPLLDARGALPRTELPAGGYSRLGPRLGS